MICFVINYCERDEALMLKSANAVAALYDEADIFDVEDRPHLKSPQFAGAWTERWMMRAVLSSDADVIVKIDPDTRAVNPVEIWPEADVFGQWSKIHEYPYGESILLGGCIGFQRLAVLHILESGFLHDEKYKQGNYVATNGISLQDPITFDVAKRLGLTMAAWPGLDLKMFWEEDKSHPQSATFVHPVRD